MFREVKINEKDDLGRTVEQSLEKQIESNRTEIAIILIVPGQVGEFERNCCIIALAAIDLIFRFDLRQRRQKNRIIHGAKEVSDIFVIFKQQTAAVYTYKNKM